MKDQENNPMKANQNKPEQKQKTSSNEGWNKGAETGKKGNQNWDDGKENNPEKQRNANETQKSATTRVGSAAKTQAGANPQQGTTGTASSQQPRTGASNTGKSNQH